MAAEDKRAHPRYPIWLPINVLINEERRSLPAMLCDVSEGGALVWGSWSNTSVQSAALEVVAGGITSLLDCEVVAVECLWDTVVLHLRFVSRDQVDAADLTGAIEELRENFRSHQKYLAFRADDDPGLARTSTQYPGERASA